MLGFRKLFLKYFRFFEQKEYQVFCILLIFEELLYTLIYIRLFIYGEQLGYPPEIVSINGLLFALLFVSAIILLLSIVSALRKEYLAKQKLSHMTALSEYTANLEKLYKILCMRNHDYKNLFSTAYSYIDTGNLSGLRAFYEKSLTRLYKEFDISNNEIANLSNIHLPEIKGILYSKALLGISQKINIKICVEYPINSVTIDTTDLVRILGIYLDNAIESALDTDEKEMSIYISKKNGESYWTIANTCPKLDFNISDINVYGFSTKGKNRGIGLYTVSKILNNYPHILSSTQIKEMYFIQTLQNI